MTLHTWGQKLDLHPHVHCVVTGGGLSLDENHWVVGSDHFFLPDRVLGRVFRDNHAIVIEQSRISVGFIFAPRQSSPEPEDHPIDYDSPTPAS